MHLFFLDFFLYSNKSYFGSSVCANLFVRGSRGRHCCESFFNMVFGLFVCFSAEVVFFQFLDYVN